MVVRGGRQPTTSIDRTTKRRKQEKKQRATNVGEQNEKKTRGREDS